MKSVFPLHDGSFSLCISEGLVTRYLKDIGGKFAAFARLCDHSRGIVGTCIQ